MPLAGTAREKQEAEKKKKKTAVAAGHSYGGAHAHAHEGARRAVFLICGSCFWCATLLPKSPAMAVARRCPRCGDGRVRPMSIGSGEGHRPRKNDRGSLGERRKEKTAALTSAA